jgi:hypothetical protein
MGDGIQADEMDGACGPCEEKQKYIQSFGGKTWLKEAICKTKVYIR